MTIQHKIIKLSDMNYKGNLIEIESNQVYTDSEGKTRIMFHEHLNWVDSDIPFDDLTIDEQQERFNLIVEWIESKEIVYVHDISEVKCNTIDDKTVYAYMVRGGRK
jgi:hypothetical protein